MARIEHTQCPDSGGALTESAASREHNYLLTTQLMRSESADEPREAQALIEMRYQQHLALRELQDLFESEELQIQ
jgi:hypothetical protein